MKHPQNILLVLGGHPPGHDLLSSMHTEHDFVIAVDGGYNILQETHLTADLVLGDMDSILKTPVGESSFKKLSDQDQTDLQKTFTYIQNSYSPESVTLLGALGRRSDHLIHNLHICALQPQAWKISIVNQLSNDSQFKLETIHRLTPKNDIDLRVKKGTTLSLFHVSPYSDLRAGGLKWNLPRNDSPSGVISQSNQVLVDKVTMTLGSGCVYVAVYQ